MTDHRSGSGDVLGGPDPVGREDELGADAAGGEDELGADAAGNEDELGADQSGLEDELGTDEDGAAGLRRRAVKTSSAASPTYAASRLATSARTRGMTCWPISIASVSRS